MEDFKSSSVFVDGVMSALREYEIEASRRRERARAFLCSKPVLLTLSAFGILLGLFNALRMALILISPALCL